MGVATITSVIVWKIYHGSEKDSMFFFSTNVACIITSTQRKHITNKVKDSVIFYKLIFRGYTTLHQGYETVLRDDV